ncbi:MAG: cupredoxin domain-containing protein [Chloroflexi bacterium]|nr:cupredoxin domain-containing protein [Chloroflexota bacterium]
MTATRFSRRFALVLVAGLLTGGALAACGSSDDSSPGNGTPVPTAAKVVTVPAGAPLIDQDNLAFKPEKLTVKAGATVYFLNSETSLHTVTIDGKNVSGTMKKGDVVVWTAPNAGTFKVTCDFHPQMKATITAE